MCRISLEEKNLDQKQECVATSLQTRILIFDIMHPATLGMDPLSDYKCTDIHPAALPLVRNSACWNPTWVEKFRYKWKLHETFMIPVDWLMKTASISSQPSQPRIHSFLHTFVKQTHVCLLVVDSPWPTWLQQEIETLLKPLVETTTQLKVILQPAALESTIELQTRLPSSCQLKPKAKMGSKIDFPKLMM